MVNVVATAGVFCYRDVPRLWRWAYFSGFRLNPTVVKRRTEEWFEGSSFGKKGMRQVPHHSTARTRPRHLHQSATQATARLMARVAGVDLPRDKRTEIALTYIFGIGSARSREILEATGVNPDTRVRELTDDEVVSIRRYIDQNLKVEGDLRREVSQDIKRKMEIGSYQGLRHRRGLPVRGQRTHTNARTRKGPRKTVPGKKRAAKKH